MTRYDEDDEDLPPAVVAAIAAALSALRTVEDDEPVTSWARTIRVRPGWSGRASSGWRTADREHAWSGWRPT